ncbi:MAG: hypothetical protein NVS9B4_28010 [Candidatus Acidiferrum sp.]
MRHGVRSILQRSRPDWEICGEATDGREAVRAVQRLRPDVIILDITMPEMSGLQAAVHMSKLGLHSRILIFTMHESARMGSDVRRVGAHGYVQKSEAGRDLVRAIDALLAGGTFYGPKADSDLSAKNDDPDTDVSFCEALEVAWALPLYRAFVAG